MKIELKKIQHAAFASEETHCFTADIYIDGKRAGTASNSGHGGCTDCHFDDPEMYGTVKTYTDTLPDIEYELGEHKGSYSNDIEHIVDEQVNDWIITTSIRKDLQKRIMWTKEDGSVYQTGVLKAAQRDKLLADVRAGNAPKNWKHVAVLNLLPLSEAAAILRAI